MEEIEITVRERVLAQFASGEALGAREVMERTGLGRTVYRALNSLVASGELVKLRKRATPRKKRWIYSLPDVGPRF